MDDTLLSVRESITMHFREGIVSGRLSPGSALPSTQEIAASFGTTPPNVQRALTLLVEEGLIDRRPRLGSFVRARRRELTGAVLYLPAIGHTGSTPFRALCGSLLEKRMRREKLHFRVVVDNADGDGLRQLDRLANTGKYQAVFSIELKEDRLAQVLKSSLSSIGITANPMTPRVTLDYPGFTEPVARAFAEAGCRRVMALAIRNPAYYMREHGISWARGVLEPRLRAHGIELLHHDLPLKDGEVPEKGIERTYDDFNAVWDPSAPPDGLFVYPDDRLPAVMAAMLRHGVRPEKDFRRIILHGNRELPFHFPAPYLKLEACVTDIVDAVLELWRRRHAGEAVTKIVLPHRLVPCQGN